MKYLILALALAGCTTTKPDVEVECLHVGSDTGTMTLCPMPAGIVCIEKNGGLSCLQLQDPVLRAQRY